MNIRKIINEVIQEFKVDEGFNEEEIHPPNDFDNLIPTLKKGIFRSASPQLIERFKLLGKWEFATHGDWLGIDDMLNLWEDNLTPYTESINAAIDHWVNDAASLFKKSRVSIFAASEDTNERVYLIWFDCIKEPEVWSYDSNGESRFKDLASYLQAYLNDDLSMINVSWKLSDDSPASPSDH